MADEFKINRISELVWHGKIGSSRICEFQYFKDSQDRIWINIIGTYGNFQKMGYGSKMLIEALKFYKVIYISSAEKREVKAKGIPNDFRYTNDENLMLFIEKCIQKDILKKEWFKHPFK